MIEVLEHRVASLERRVQAHEQTDLELHKDLELRVRVLEIAHAKLVAYAAGGAFVGGIVFQLVQLIFR